MRWRETKLKHLAKISITSGLGEAGSHAEPSWPRYVRTTDIAGPTTLRDDTFASLPPAVAMKAMLQPGDILMTTAGATIGKSMTFLDSSPACYAGFLARFRANELADRRFVAFWMQSRHYWAQIETGAVRSTIDNFAAGRYRNLELSIPDMHAQRRIADFLDDQVARLDQAAAGQQSMLRLQSERRQTMLGDLFGVTDPIGVIEGHYTSAHGWPTKKLAHLLADTISGGTPTSSEQSYWSDPPDGTPWLSIGDMREGASSAPPVKHLTGEGLASARLQLAPAGTVLFAMYASLGKTSRSHVEAVWNQAILGLIPNSNLQSDFLLYWLQYIRPALSALARSATQNNFNAEQVRSIHLPAPELSTQDAVVDQMRERDGVLQDLANRRAAFRELLQERKLALITAAVTGQFDVTTARSAA